MFKLSLEVITNEIIFVGTILEPVGPKQANG